MYLVPKPVLIYKAANSRWRGLQLACLSVSVLFATAVAHAESPISLSSASPAFATSSSPLISLDFSKAAVSDILMMVGQQGGVDVVIGEDVTGTLKSVHLTDKTADQAIRIVAQAAGLSWKKSDSKTYIISKAALSSTGSVDLNSGLATNPNGVDPTSPEPLFLPAPLQPAKQMDSLTTTASIEIRNVKPRIMAFWLDPGHQPIPDEFVKSDDKVQKGDKTLTESRMITPNPQNPNANNGLMAMPQTQPGSGYLPFNPYASPHPYTASHPQFGNVTGGTTTGGTSGSNGNSSGSFQSVASGAGTVALPRGVDNLIAIDAQNILLVRGTDDGIDRIRELVRFLDKPIAQVEIEAQFVTVSATDKDIFGLSLGSNSASVATNPTTSTSASGADSLGSVNLSYTRGNFQATLQAQITKGRARVVQAPRVTTFNNLAAQVESSTTTTVPITQETVVPNGNGTSLILRTTNYFSISSGTTLTVIPTVNRDGTITISLQPTVRAFNPSTNGSPFPDTFTQTISTSANIKDGDTLAIGGLRTQREVSNKGGIPFLKSIPLIGGLFKSKNKEVSDQELIIFVTAHVVRSIDDPIPGT